MFKIFVALDRSGSMQGEKWTGAIESINEYIANLKKEEVEGTVTIVAFDSDMRNQVRLVNILDNKSIAYYTPLGSSETIQPSGMTPLYDASAHVMDLALESKAERAVVIILTDGHENASREYDQTKIKAKTDALTKRGLEVIFLGANFDVAEYTKSAGLDMGKMRNFDLTSLQSRMRTSASLGDNTVMYAKCGASMNIAD